MLKKLNPDAQIVITEIPNSSPSSSVYLKVENSLGSYNRDLWDLHAFMDSMSEPFNKSISEECKSRSDVDHVQLSRIFDGSAELSLAVVESSICLSDVMAGDYSAFTRFDVHPSSQGHMEMAQAHISALEGLSVIDKWISEYNDEPVKQTDYKISQTFGKSEIELSARVYLDKDMRVVYEITVNELSRLENLLATVSFDSKKLAFVSIELEGASESISGAEGGSVKLIVHKDNVTAENAVITVVLERLDEDVSEIELGFTACESRLTYGGEWKAESDISGVVDIDALEMQGENKGVDPDAARVVVYVLFSVVFAIIALSAIAAIVVSRKKKS